MKLSSGTLLSVLIHVLVLAVLIVDVPHAMPEPEKPKAIQVELLPPKKKAKAKPAQKPKPAAKKQSKPKKSTSKQSAKAKPRQVLRPVFKFGEKDSGSGKPVKGDAKREENIARTTPVKKPNKEPIESKLTPTVPLTTQSDTTKAAASKKAATAKVVAKAAAAASASKPKPKLPAKNRQNCPLATEGQRSSCDDRNRGTYARHKGRQALRYGVAASVEQCQPAPLAKPSAVLPVGFGQYTAGSQGCVSNKQAMDKPKVSLRNRRCRNRDCILRI